MSRVALAFALGVIAAGQLATLPPLIEFVGAAALSVGLLLCGQRVLPAFGCGWLYALAWIALSCNERLAAADADRVLHISGRVVGLATTDERRTQFDLALDRGASPGRVDHVRLSWYGAPAPPSDAHCTLKVRLQRMHGFANPAGFDAEAWALSRDIDATGYVRDDNANICRPALQHSIATLRDHLRDAIRATHLRHADELVALVLGDGSGLTTQQWLLLQQTGTVHLIVISGLHITMIAVAVFALCTWAMRLSPWLLRSYGARAPAALIAALLTVGYCALAGFSIPTVRAMLMAGLGLLAAALQRRSQWQVGLALAVAAVHIWQPLAWREPGFWLSFVSVAALLRASATQIERAEVFWRRWLRIWLRTQWSMLVVFTPLLLLIFGNAPLISPVANALAEPLVSLLIVPLAAVGTLLLPLSAAVAMSLLQLADALLDGMWWYLQTLLPLAKQTALHGAAAPSLLLLAGVLAASPRGVPGRWLAPLLAGAALYAVPAGAPPRGEVRLLVFDVGQGSAALVTTATHQLLVDTGPRFSPDFEAGSAILAPALLSQNIVRLDGVVVSHADQDHAGGFAGVANRIAIDDVWEPYAPMLRNVIAPHRCRDGTRWRWDDVEFIFLGPSTPLASIENDRSCVLLVRSRGGATALLPGDISAREEQRLVIEHANELANLNLLIAAHHGSKSSSSAAFVRLLQPHAVIFSAGWHSRFGHPHPVVVTRFAEVGSTQWTTGDAGALQWQSDHQDIQAQRCRARKPWLTTPLSCAARL